MIKQFGYLVALAREQHFGRAAQACNISQPTLSGAIRQLEETLGVTIVERGHRFNGFTAEGQRVLDHARRILADCDAMRQEIAGLKGGLTGRLRLGAVPTALPLVARLTSPFHRHHPNVSLTLLSLTSIEIQRRIDDFELDAGITYLDFEPVERVRRVPLYREDYLLLTPSDGPFGALGRPVTWVEAATLPLCLLTPDMQNRRIIDALFRGVGAQPTIGVETNSITNLITQVVSGLWSSVVPAPILAQFGVPEGTKALPLSEPHGSQTVGLIVADRHPLAPVVAALLDIASRPNLMRFDPSRSPARV